MTPTHTDYAVLALCLWREARGQGQAGMTAVGCVVRNRVQRHNSSFYTECTKKWQFSSISAPGDPQLGLWPAASDLIWGAAQILASNLIDGHVDDITNGATLYYDDSIAFPASWNRNKVVPLGMIGKFHMFREVW